MPEHAILTAAAAHAGRARQGIERPPRTNRLPAGAVTSFGPLKQIDAGVLNVGYAEAGPVDGPPVILLHGWPYDIHSFVDVAPLLASAGYRVIIPYLRGYGTTRFLSADTVRNGQPSALAARHVALHGCAQDREGDDRRLRLGRADGQHRRGALAGALQGDGVRQRLSDRQPGGRQDAVAAEGRAAVVVPVLLRHRARPRRLRQVPARLRQAHLAARFAQVAIRRRDVRSQRGGLRQSGSRRHRDPQLPLAARAGRKARRSTTSSRSGSPRLPSSPCPRSPSKATPTARRIPIPAPTRRNSPASMRTASSPAASATTCRRKRRRRSRRRSSTSTSIRRLDLAERERKASAPGSRNSISNTRSTIGPGCRMS